MLKYPHFPPLEIHAIMVYCFDQLQKTYSHASGVRQTLLVVGMSAETKRECTLQLDCLSTNRKRIVNREPGQLHDLDGGQILGSLVQKTSEWVWLLEHSECREAPTGYPNFRIYSYGYFGKD